MGRTGGLQQLKECSVENSPSATVKMVVPQGLFFFH